jgi:hypothetical protein
MLLSSKQTGGPIGENALSFLIFVVLSTGGNPRFTLSFEEFFHDSVHWVW